MRASRGWLVLFALALGQLGLVCTGVPKIVIVQPGEAVGTCAVSVEIDVPSSDFVFDPATGVTIDFQSLPVTGGPDRYTALIEPDALTPGENLLLVRAQRTSDQTTITAGRSFDYRPPLRAFEIDDPADLITGPLAHNRLGDTMLENCLSRFVIQDVAQRDFYSVGQFGGNLIDAELIGREGLDHFLEIAPMVNVETVVNPQTLEIVNDGADGNPAVVRTCGPDDLLDFVNPSTQVTDAGLPFPANANDNDQLVTGCTEFTLASGNTWVEMETTVFNEDSEPIDVIMGDWLNQAGALDVFILPNDGLGPALFNTMGVLSAAGYDEATGVDYAYTSTTGPGEYVIISGVTVILDSTPVLQALLGGDPGTTIPVGGQATATRYFGVGDGSGSNAVDMEIDIKQIPHGFLSGCVTVGGAPAPSATVSVGTLDGAAFKALVTHFTTDEAGCYAGKVPVPDPLASYGVMAGREGAPYEGGANAPPLTLIDVTMGSHATVDFALPDSATLHVTCNDAEGGAIPARATVVGFDPSPEPLVAGPSLPGFGGSTLGQLNDPQDRLPFGVVAVGYCDVTGEVIFEVEPGSYQLFVSRGSEWSAFETPLTLTAGVQTDVTAAIARVVASPGFVSSDFHVHGIHSADSRVGDLKRVIGYAGNGVDNIIMTDHGVHTDLSSEIAAQGLGTFVASTIGEEITTFDSGHFNGYPFLIDDSVPSATANSGGSTDWGVAAPPGMDFPSFGALNATSAGISALAKTLPGSGGLGTPETVIQVNHIDSHFAPLRIDTKIAPVADDLDGPGRLERRLPAAGNLFFHHEALELWNGSSAGARSEFLDERIGIWMNLLNQGLPTTFVASTDSHRFTDLSAAGASTWTAASSGNDSPATLDSAEVGLSVAAGRAVTGQGLYVQARLLARDGSNAVADFTWDGTTQVVDSGGDVDLEISVQAPLWAEYDTIEIYVNAETTAVPMDPYLYGATPLVVLQAGVDFTADVVEVDMDTPGASRRETLHVESFDDLVEDTWFVVVVRGSDGVSKPMFPVFPRSLTSAGNDTLEDLLDGNLGELGVRALGATNALYYLSP